jgi:hypothetical protein
MEQFIARHRDHITGTLSGFDRLVFRGTLRKIAHVGGLKGYLWANDVLLKHFGAHALAVSHQLKTASLAEATRQRRPVRYLCSRTDSKEAIAREIATRDGITDGLVCVLTCVEPCWSFDVYRNRATHQLDLVARWRQCLFLYHYWVDRELGFLNARIQTWLPFPVQVCLNGREWLARQLDRAGIAFVRQDNCFPWIADWAEAQRLLDAQLHTAWPPLLDRIAAALNPAHATIVHQHPVPYYWSTYQSEWAIDVVFRHAAVLRRLYPRWLQHGMSTFGSTDVLRFLGRPTPGGEIPGAFTGELTSDLKRREEGVRIKHRLNHNSVKLYDKAFTPVGSVLRAETTIQDAGDFRVFRPIEGAPDGPATWRKMRKGIADLYRRAEVSRKATERYLDAFASVDDDTTLDELLTRWAAPTRWHGRRVRALRPLSDDRRLLDTLSRGEFTINGLRNRDLQAVFFHTPAATPREARRRSAWVSRRLRLLRAHGLLRKVSGTHRYHVTHTGRRALTAILTAFRATIRQLTAAA